MASSLAAAAAAAFGGDGGERSRLLSGKRHDGGGGDGLRWWSRGGGGEGGEGGRHAEYIALAPWDAWLGLTLLAILACLLASSQDELREDGLLPKGWDRRHVLDFDAGMGTIAALCVLVAVVQTPRKVIRRGDTFTIQYPCHERSIPTSEILELEMLGHGGHFFDLMWRWGVFPFGCQRIALFSGLPSVRGTPCALLTTRVCWSYLFSLEDPIKFLVDNQRPLDIGATYRTVGRALVREGESLTSRRIGMTSVGIRLKVERQSGRRVLVEFERTKTRGWISHINQLGYFLLAKERGNADINAAEAGASGASELATTYGAAIELSAVPGADDSDGE